MTISTDAALLDANVLVYAMNEESEHHFASRRTRDRATSGEIHACLAHQVLFEYFAVVTNPRLLRKPLAVAEAVADVELLASVFPVLSTPVDLHSRVCELIRSTGRSGRRVFDLVLAATMLAHGVSRIFTFDSGFAGIPGITSLAP